MAAWKVGYIVGSLAKASINRKLSKALVRLAPAGLELTEIPIRDLPLYSYDYDADFPAPAKSYKKALEDAQALLFVTPEYNRGIPGGLEERDRLGEPPARIQCLRAQALGRDRRLARENRHRRRPARIAQRARRRRLAADGYARGLHSVHART